MGRGNAHTHWPSGKKWQERYRAWNDELKVYKPATRIVQQFFCGESADVTSKWINIAKDIQDIRCPKCNARYWATQVAMIGDVEMRKIADEPGTEKYRTPGTYDGHRFVHEVIYKGERVGFIFYDGAYGGGSWHLYDQDFKDYYDDLKPVDDNAKLVPNGAINTYDLKRTGVLGVAQIDRHEGRNAYPFISKEQAMMFVPALVERGELHARPDLIQRRKERREAAIQRKKDEAAAEIRRKEEAARWEAEKAEDMRQLRSTLADLRELRAQMDAIHSGKKDGRKAGAPVKSVVIVPRFKAALDSAIPRLEKMVR